MTRNLMLLTRSGILHLSHAPFSPFRVNERHVTKKIQGLKFKNKLICDDFKIQIRRDAKTKQKRNSSGETTVRGRRGNEKKTGEE